MSFLRCRFITSTCVGFVLLLAFTLISFAQVSNVTTIAGGYVGDGGPATSAAFNGPWLYATTDSNGNLFVSDSPDSRVRRVNSKGIITTIAGTGIYGYGGDGGPATSAVISYPRGIAVDKAGNVYFSDSANRRVRKIDTNGIITTFAGNGGFGPPGDGGPATDADLYWPQDLFFDSAGNLYITDTNAPAIRMVDSAGIIHLVAGVYNGYGFSGDGGPATSAELYYPAGIAKDSSGNLYIADRDNHRIRKVDSTGTITTFAGNGNNACPSTGDGGPATSASIPYPSGLAVKQNRLLITDNCSRVRVINLQTNVINAAAGTGTGCFNGDGLSPLSTDLCGPWSLSVDPHGNLIETETGRVRRITGTVQTIAGGYIGDNGPARNASVTNSWPGNNLAFDSKGNVYIADSEHMRIRKIDTHGSVTTFAGTGLSGSSGDGGPAISATFYFPNAVAADGSGNVFIGDATIRKVDTNGIINSFFSASYYVTGLATDTSGNVYAADYGACVIWKITPSGAATIFAGVQYSCGYNGDGIAATQAQLWPLGVATDSKGNVYIADYINNRIRMVDTSGTIQTVAGNGLFGFGGDGGPATSAELFMPQGVSVDKSGNIYIADTSNTRVRQVNSSGTIVTLAGTGLQGYNGDHLPAIQTNLYPVTVIANPNGAVLVMDNDGFRVRRIK